MSITVTAKVDRRIVEKAKRYGINISKLMREALRKEVERREREGSLNLLEGNVVLTLTPYEMGNVIWKETKLYINRGLGTTFFPVRFNCPPEVTMLKVSI